MLLLLKMTKGFIDPDLIGFFDVVFGVHEGMGEFTIIGYQNETFTHKIKTSNCVDPFG